MIVFSAKSKAVIECYKSCPSTVYSKVIRILLSLAIVVPSSIINAMAKEHYSPVVNDSYPSSVYWGDTHLHTSLSVDAYNFGNRLGPEEAYQFAKGLEITANNGMPVKLRRPLDFLVIADHASNVGLMEGLESGHQGLLSTDSGKKWSKKLSKSNALKEKDFKKSRQLAKEMYRDGFSEDEVVNREFLVSVWKENIRIADKHNTPGKFTALIGYEWTSWFYSLHRVVIFKDGAERIGQVTPFSQYDSLDPEDLWEYMEIYEQGTGGEVLAIPHNGNLSIGVMFALEDAKGNSLSKQYAAMRSRWEPLYEVTQIKGDGETHPLNSPLDEFADYETFALETLLGTEERLKRVARDELSNAADYSSWFAKHAGEKNFDWARPYEYARSALKLGLQQKAKLGVNPFKFGMIGSTDSHTSLATADENNFWGKMPWVLREYQPSKERLSNLFEKYSGVNNLTHSAAGYAAIWAEENTRESLFAAMKRKEVYASTGPRINVRFFGGWEYQKNDAFSPDLARIGYQKGVPMGGDLTSAPNKVSPKFLIRAVKDPDGANLDRVQVIKGWHDAHGELHEKIYNVALSDGRKENRNGKVKPVGNTVDIPDASYTNTIGDPELAVVWEDPDFDASELAFYYVRVLEIPTPRWTAYDAKYFQVKDISKDVPMITQERAYTSSIWYTPEKYSKKTHK